MKKQEVYNELLNDVKNECKKIGINAEFAVDTKKDYLDRDYQYIKSSSIKTTPKIFDEIHVEGFTWTADFGSKKYWYLTVDLHYYWTLPNHQGTGHSNFGRIQFEILKRGNKITYKGITMPKND